MLVHISAQTITFPRACACCGADPQTNLRVSSTRTTGKRVVRTDTRWWEFPYCYGCVAHVQAWPQPAGCATILLGLCTCGIYFFIDAASRRNAEARARSMCGSSCCAPNAAVAYQGWSGSVHSFEVTSPNFGLDLMRANRRRLVNVDWNVAPLLDQPRHAPALPPPSLPRPQLPSAPVDEHELFRQAVESIERARGPAGRRAALDGGLRTLSNQSYREQLMLEASRIEVAAVLDKVDGLKTVAAKRRNLEAALAAIRSDEVPDHLQAEQIRWLEDALRALGDGK